ncbi:MAG: zinc ribbon domain-containing protein [Candidatus Thorarchaeota archaeon]
MSKRVQAWKRRSYQEAKDKAGYCPHCGKPLKIGDKICSSCRKNPNVALNPDKVTEKKQKECPKCKSLNDPSSVVCSSCGINFTQYEMSQPLDLSGMSALRKRKRQ